MTYDFDLFVIGAGSGGIATARRAAEYGAKVGIAEDDRLGGTCVNRGCVPKKLMVYASHFPEQFHDAAGYGWSAVQSQLDWPKMVKAVNDEVTRLNGIYQRMLDKSEVQVFRESARFVDSHTVQVGDRQVSAEKILIAVGGKPIKPNIPGLEHAITSDEMFHLPQQPKHLVVLGGGYIGVEFACILRGLGSEVTVVIRREKILNGFDEDLRDCIQEGMINHGIRILNNTNITSVEQQGDGTLKLNLDTQEGSIVADTVTLSATGRKPRLEGLGLEHTKVEVKKGAIAVDEYSQTAEPHIFAVGDCTDRVNLTPVAINEGRVFADTHFGGKSRQMSYENIPTAVFSSPEAATVGLTEAEAREEYGDRIKIFRSKFRPMYHTLGGRDERTLMKLVVDSQSDRVLGAHMVGESAAEIIQGVAIAVKMGATKADFDATVGIHPSSAEEFVTMR
ncbi:glutathione-disulfide reductase [Phormidium yuhuli AB48]|uniref:Glutathione reductase n=1 Tax=Phormidium yuhuli AB48 TaxID=2940671 RepID=A0ABY5ALI0_9CYAN|nr:glutathione-disulfide reductase [Phormidium yuhuli]USR89680.1 glutathione-disulfide reductase [Phormidium yuhuli AB48]